MRFVTIGAILAAFAAVAVAQPSVATGGVLNAASFSRDQSVAPGSLVSIFGTNLGTALAQADSVPLSTSLGGTSVTFNNIPAPMLFVSHAASGDQINAQIPWEVQGSSAQIVVTQGGRTSSAVAVPLAASAPGIFSVNFGTGQAIAYSNTTYAIAAAAGAIPGLNTAPAKIGDQGTLVILATGLGPVNPPVKTGADANDGLLHSAVTTPEVLVGGVPAQVVFAGMTPQFVGVYQLNIIIAPGTPTGGAIPLQIRMNGLTTTNQVTIAVSNLTPAAQIDRVAAGGWSLSEFVERTLAAALLVLLWPLLATLAALLFLLSGRAPLIAHRRVGRYGRDLWVWKFRTLWQARGRYAACFTEFIDDEAGPARKHPSDGRVSSAFAAFCRRHSLDELPQLWNVLAGEMSLVGPRPVTRREAREIFGAAASEIQQVKPGLTGLWQVSGRNRLSPAQRRQLDLELVRTRSPRLYLTVLLRTVPELVGGNNSW